MFGAAVHDFLPDRVAAGERQLVQPRVRTEGRADGAGTDHDIQHPGRQAQRFCDLGVDLFYQRRDLRRLEHHGAAGGQGRGNLPGAGHQGEVPGHDQAHHAQGLDPAMGLEAGSRQRHFAVRGGVQLLGQPGVVGEGGDGIVQVDTGFVPRLAVIAHLQLDQRAAASFEFVGEALQIVPALAAAEAAPRTEGLARGSDGEVDLLRAGALETGNDLAQ